MGARYLVELADVLRGAGLEVVELDGWQYRARSSGGYDGGPWLVMWHHTASSGDGADDADYCTYRDEDAPLTNLVIGRDGVVYVCAGGATNTNGKGGPMLLPDGRTVPQDGCNTRAVGVELSNGGTGMTYPAVQIDAAMTASLAVCAAYGLRPDNASEHVSWAPDRKVDPATAYAVDGAWTPRAINSSGSWDLVDLRAELVHRSLPPIPEPAPEEDDKDMAFVTQAEDGSLWVVAGDCSSRFALWAEDYSALVGTGKYPVVALRADTLSRIPGAQFVDEV